MLNDDLKYESKNIKDQVEEIVNKHVDYYRLWAFKVLTKSASGLLKIFAFGLIALSVLLFLSLAAAIGIGSLINSIGYGFLIIGGVYIILLVLVFIMRKKIFDKIILKYFSEMFFKDE